MQEYYVLFWTNPGNSTLQNSNYMATNLPLYKPLNMDEKDILWTAVGYTDCFSAER